MAAIGVGVGLGWLGAPPTAQAADLFWTGGSGNFNNVADANAGTPGWNGGLPGTRDNGLNNIDGTTITIDTTSTNTGTPGSVALDDIRSATETSNVNSSWTQTAGTTVTLTGSGWFRLGNGANTTGTYNLNGGTIQNEDGNQWNIGEGANGTGILNMNGGTLINTNGGANFIAIGNNRFDAGSTGTLNMSNGAVINTNGELWVGQGGGSNGTLNLTDGTINIHNWFAIGRDSANGTVNMTGGTVNKDSATNRDSHITFSGLGSGQTGTWNMSGGAINVADGGNSIWLAENATGVINMTGGSITAANGIEISHANGNGTLRVSGGTINAPGGIELSHGGGDGTLILQGAGSGATGPLANGGGTQVVTAPTVTIGSADTNFNGNINNASVVLEGGTLATNGITGGFGSGNKVLSFNGGVLQALADSLSFLGAGDVTSQVLASPAIIDTNGHAVTVSSALVSGVTTGRDGGLIKNGAGVLTLTASNSYSGPTLVNAGTLAVTNFLGNNATGAGNITVAAAGTLTGTGALNLGSSVVTINGTLAPGATATAGDIGTLLIATTGTITLGNTSTFAFDLVNAGTKDLIAANGARLALSGTLALNLGAGFDYSQTYTLFSNLAAAPTGAFTSVTGVGAGRQAVFEFSGSNYNVRFAAIPEPSTWALGVFGLGGMAAVWTRRRRLVG